MKQDLGQEYGTTRSQLRKQNQYNPRILYEENNCELPTQRRRLSALKTKRRRQLGWCWAIQP